MNWALSVVTAPKSEPVTVSEAQLHLRVDGVDENALIARLIQSAREYCEPIARRAFMPQTLMMSFSAWPACADRNYLELLRPPVQSVSNIKYYDSAGVLQTMTSSDYVADLVAAPPRIYLADGVAWPSATLRAGLAIEVTYVAGYAKADVVPARYKQAMLLLIGHWYENREQIVVAPGATSATLRLAVESLLTSGRGMW